MKTLLLAGTHSGCGKTTAMLALLQHLRTQARSVVAFKSGPDFLDPLWHRAVLGRPGYNLDTHMIGADLSRQILAEQAERAEFGLIEGVMGMFDGHSGVGKAGSSADLAKVLGVPSILVVDASGLSGSIVPMVAGYCDYALRRGVTIAGIVANKVGGAGHAALLHSLLVDNGQPPLLAWLEHGAPEIPERHLGLVRPEESKVPDYGPFFHIDDGKLERIFADASLPQSATPIKQSLLDGKSVAVVCDAACCFIYQANLDWLREQGARVRFFSVLRGEPIPPASDSLWLPGGYPELYARQLAVSKTWPSLNRFVEADKPVLAECGGAMLLGDHLIDRNGESWPMAGVLPYTSKMQENLVALGYRRESGGVRGHEFHYSIRNAERPSTPAFACDEGDCGVQYKRLRASYVHWYFASAPKIVAGWLS